MLSVFIFGPCYVQLQCCVLSQAIRCKVSALDMTGMLWAGLPDVIILRVMTARVD